MGLQFYINGKRVSFSQVCNHIEYNVGDWEFFEYWQDVLARLLDTWKDDEERECIGDELMQFDVEIVAIQ